MAGKQGIVAEDIIDVLVDDITDQWAQASMMGDMPIVDRFSTLFDKAGIDVHLHPGTGRLVWEYASSVEDDAPVPEG